MKRGIGFLSVFIFIAISWGLGLAGGAEQMTPSGDDGWAFVSEKNGVSLYKQEVPGSDYYAFKAITEVDASMAAVGAVLRDVSSYPQWMAKISEAKVLKAHTPNNMDAYFVMDFPWPTNDRDVILNGQTTVDPETGNVTIASKIISDPAVPPQEDKVRVHQLTQRFLLVYKDFNTTEVTFSLHFEAGGNLPAFTVNPATQSVPYHSLQALEEIAKGEKYRDADPLDAVNLPITEAIITAILKKHIQDEAIIKLVVSDKALMNVAIRSGYSPEGLRKTVAVIICKYVKTPMYAEKIAAYTASPEDKALLGKLSTDDALVKRLAGDKEIVALLLEAGGMTDPVLKAIVVRIKDMTG